MPKLSIITVNYNQAAVTAELLQSIQAQSFQDLEVIVVDNASTENPFPLLTTIYPNLIAVKSEKNVGFAGGNNLGIVASSGEYLFFINNDAEVVEGTIDTLIDALEAHPKIGIISPKLCYYTPERPQRLIQYVGTTPIHPLTGRNTTIGQMENDLGQYDVMAHPTPYAHGAAMMLPKTVVDRVGEMPEVFFLYYEELDWCEQIRRAGYEIYVHPYALVYHKESVSVGPLSLLKTYYINRNRILFMKRNRSTAEFLLFSSYVFLVMLPFHSFKFLLQAKVQHAKTLWKAVVWNYGFS
ncbi:MAG: glycosyltransferase family 2 protein [Bacteroidota bacterium]